MVLNETKLEHNNKLFVKVFQVIWKDGPDNSGFDEIAILFRNDLSVSLIAPINYNFENIAMKLIDHTRIFSLCSLYNFSSDDLSGFFTKNKTIVMGDFNIFWNIYYNDTKGNT